MLCFHNIKAPVLESDCGGYVTSLRLRDAPLPRVPRLALGFLRLLSSGPIRCPEAIPRSQACVSARRRRCIRRFLLVAQTNVWMFLIFYCSL